MSKHSPGPWHFDKENNGFHGYDKHNGIMDNEGRSIVEVPHQYSLSATPSTPLPWEANAHLIAAAPDMLEALDWCCKNMCPNRKDDFCKEVCEIKATIAKAEGRTT